jgi:DNA (cytosine-5)-methyltransferase 1
MRYLSLFSGMEAAHLAWSPLGWTCTGVAEIDPRACELLAHRLPHVPNLGSVTDITAERVAALGPLDVVIGGSPCQDLSVAGKRAGLGGARSGLFHEQLRIFHAARHFCGARWLVWENVPGAFSSNAGRDFAVVVGSMAGLDLAVPRAGWGNEGMAVGENGLVEWSVLDAQWFGVAQRRRRVFAVLDTGNWADRRPVLLERDSLRGDSAPRREAGEGSPVGALAGTSPGGGWRVGADEAAAGQLIAAEITGTLATSGGHAYPGTCAQDAGEGFLVGMASGQANAEIFGETACTLQCLHEAPIVAHTLRGDGFDASEDGTGRGTPLVPVAFQSSQSGVRVDEVHATLDSNNGSRRHNGVLAPLAFTCKDHGADAGEVSPTLRSMGHDGSHANAGGQVAVAYPEHGGICDVPAEKLRALRQAVPAADFEKWGLGVAKSVGAQEVLRSLLHGGGVRCEAIEGQELDDRTLPCEEAGAAGGVQRLWEAGCVGRAPPGWQPPEQLARELGAYLPLLPHEGAQAARFLFGLWQASEGLGLLRQALSAIQEVGRPARCQAEPAPALAVRRLTPREAERLQGAPDDWTLVPSGKKGKPMADGPRYKMLGNSFAVPVIHWIGRQIEVAHGAAV